MRVVTLVGWLFVVLISFNSCQEKPVAKTNAEPVIVHEDHVMPPLPKEVVLFGEKIEIDNFDMEERLDKELIVNTFFHSATIQILKRANRYLPEIEKILKEEGLPDDLKYLAVIESALYQATSPSGAKGFWQFMDDTGLEYELEINEDVDERFHIEKSTRAACKYMKLAHSKFDSWILAAASYNCGMGGLKSAIDEQNERDFFDLYVNNETTRYIFRIIALKLILENPVAYGFDPSTMQLYEPVPTNKIKVTSIENIGAWAKDHGTNLRMIKVLNPWLVSNQLPETGKTYQISLPTN